MGKAYWEEFGILGKIRNRVTSTECQEGACFIQSCKMLHLLSEWSTAAVKLMLTHESKLCDKQAVDNSKQ
ncbi:hypothetical protein MPTK1_6g05740 [Marchantia polymorpha subsp. ruderalis]|uniref:Uncharacterized protein n=2 Tax=Marchantia polymorpha TaxID=3197 RepID=A0AAF6BNY2_MARPO|nr:hypothetical protein MARPO_0097s0068 [Marchantia polymorpha]BBN13716.1 hypothetical protein Mp_6g05740 [Marchantia polymorpha subsp. ruderalis]|eukprot:PTQ32594.1 hypothetical protein MARPO_0097s0068 [Marchantia polymorpha]